VSQSESDERVWVLDSSALIEIKDIYSPTKSPDPVLLAAVLEHVATLLQAGQIAFPSQVKDELNRHNDSDEALAVWSRHHLRSQIYQLPGFDSVVEVVQRIPDIQDFKKQNEDADPWVVAHALELHRAGYAASVVSEDIKDKPWTASVRTACIEFGLYFIHTESFLNHCGAPRR
jgi:hypothetical protein